MKGGFLLKYGVSLRGWKGRNGRKGGIQEGLHMVQRIAAREVKKRAYLLVKHTEKLIVSQGTILNASKTSLLTILFSNQGKVVRKMHKTEKKGKEYLCSSTVNS